MSILLDARRQSRENDNQQPGTCYSGSSIWGSRFRENASTSSVAADPGLPKGPPVNTLGSEIPKEPEVFVFGSGRASSSSNFNGSSQGRQSPKEVEQLQTMLRTMQLGTEAGSTQGDSTKFSVGTQSAPFQPTSNPRPRFSKLRKSTHPTKGKTVAGTGIDTASIAGLSTQSFTFNSRASGEAAHFHAGVPSSSNASSSLFSGSEAAGLDKQAGTESSKQDQNDPSRGYSDKVDTKATKQANKVEEQFQFRTNEVAEEPFQFRASKQPSSVGVEDPFWSGARTQRKQATSGASGFSDDRSRLQEKNGVAYGGGTNIPRRGEKVQGSAASDDCKAFGFNSMRSCPPLNADGHFEGVDQLPEEDGNSVSAGFSALDIGAKTSGRQSSQTHFVFTADGQPPHADEAVPQASGVPEIPQTPQAPQAPEAGQAFGQAAFDFIFRAAGEFSSGAAKKKKDKMKKRLKKSRSASADGQGSPMDFSPCPDTGAQLSPSRTADNSECGSGEDIKPEAWNAQFQSYYVEVEELRTAAAELNLGTGNDKEAVSSDNIANASTENATGIDFFNFSANPSASSRRRRRLRGTNTKTKASVSEDNLKSRWTQVPASSNISNPAAAEHACEKWRLRGNQAYANGDFPKAEEYYSRGASSVPPNETSQSCIRATMLCYSNRAATRMAVGRMREALADCMRAMAVDPNFLRVRVRAGSCHLALGEIEAASSYFRDCLCRAKNDAKVVSEASEGLRKCQQVGEYSERVGEALCSNEFMTALRLLNEALLSAPHSEVLLELKARCLLHSMQIRKYDDLVSLCDKTLPLAEQNWPVHGQPAPRTLPKAWRWWMTAKALFHIGRLEDTLEQLQKLTEFMIVSGSNKVSQAMNADMGTLSQFSILVHDLLRHKVAGNEAFQAGKHSEAVESYTAALACNGESRPFNAVLYCNRAAASQALGYIADAIADCSRAVVLDPKYAKAISRRATLHNMIRDYSQSCTDLRRLVALHEEQSQGARKPSADLRQARERLATAEDDLRKDHPPDHYLILALQPSCTATEVKKAYRRLALRHHPDKAGNLLIRSEGIDDGKELSEEIRNDAERLFKLIGEAYATLSDATKRSRYDSEEGLRKLRTRGGSSSSEKTNHRYHNYERSSGRRRDRWDGYYHQYSRWQSGPDAAQPDTYARHSDVHWDEL